MGAEQADRGGPGLDLRGRAELAYVERALDELDAFWEALAHAVEPLDRTLFTLAISEVLTNIVQHGAAGAGAGAGAGAAPGPAEIRMTISAGRDELRAVIADTAPPAAIDWEAVAMPDADAESGRGLALARSSLDEFAHTSGDDGNTWTLRRRISTADAGE
ncbi:ATP-binding protein [Leucobacter chromiiresistens]|uniref:Serine/threonine-protein kinase RsbW n=1 Tax=Leucobacter chromiiresistens TaxID=1079994 RepID=A0A1H1A274_9MICO|nr:ATP-binding protein [Leucobacter chromiiresistens]SDQ33817.1 serine/threonine-protein kinase RsbW [Leucobacter chromiiresistens]